jgi:hypothetical protein
MLQVALPARREQGPRPRHSGTAWPRAQFCSTIEETLLFQRRILATMVPDDYFPHCSYTPTLEAIVKAIPGLFLSRQYRRFFDSWGPSDTDLIMHASLIWLVEINVFLPDGHVPSTGDSLVPNLAASPQSCSGYFSKSYQ